MNVTDVDDKIIKKSIEQNVHYKEITNKYTESFMNDMESLNVLKPDTLTYVSD